MREKWIARMMETTRLIESCHHRFESDRRHTVCRGCDRGLCKSSNASEVIILETESAH